MTRQSYQRNRGEKRGFTIVEILVVIVVIAILAGLLAVTLGPVLRRVNTFAIQQEMTQLDGAIEQFRTDYGFYPPSFKGILIDRNDNNRELDLSNNADLAIAADNLLVYINRISPNHSENSKVTGGSDLTYAEVWLRQVGPVMQWDKGEDLVFWLSGLNKNKQFPLTGGFIGGYVTFNARDLNDNLIERDVRFEFESGRLIVDPADGRTASFVQSGGERTPYLYLDAPNYLPLDAGNPNSEDGAYVNPGYQDLDGMFVSGDDFDHEDIDRVANPGDHNLTQAEANILFERIYPNPKSFQLISLGVDGLLKTESDSINPNPNKWTEIGPDGTDNVVNFAGEGPNTLETMLLDANF